MAGTVWQHALKMAGETPPSRNRYVDFLRAASIMVVVFGHWLMAAPVVTGAGLEANHLLTRATWTHSLTWALQVMPIFFFVGGYANAASWRATRRDRGTYGAWLRAGGDLWSARRAAPRLPVNIGAGLVIAKLHALGSPGP